MKQLLHTFSSKKYFSPKIEKKSHFYSLSLTKVNLIEKSFVDYLKNDLLQPREEAIERILKMSKLI